jgi:CRISPR-associated endonuclease Cas2
LEIKKPRKWDQKWRILIFDIQDKHKVKREALRGKLKELGLYRLQKSVWVCPYDFFQEMDFLREFFGLKYREMRIITASEIENDEEIKAFFEIN